MTPFFDDVDPAAWVHDPNDATEWPDLMVFPEKRPPDFEAFLPSSGGQPASSAAS